MSIRINNRRRIKKEPIKDINITPFVDVLLVLLIIFMVAAPMMTGSVNIDLPSGSTKSVSEDVPPISVTIKKDGVIFLQDNLIKLNNLPRKILKAANNDIGIKIFVRADKKIDYGRVMEIVKIINLTGFSKVVLVTELQ
jgi:biopolymer transport protein TolR